MTRFARLVLRDLVLAVRIGGGGGMAIGFFVIAVTLVPLGVGPSLETLARIAPGILWVGALLATLLSLDRLFQADYEDGSLDLLALSPLPLEAMVAAKAIAHWLTTGLPLVIAAPVLALLLNMDADGFLVLVASMAIGTPALSFIGAVGAALTVGVRRGGMLLSLIVLPLYVPVLIFGAGAVDAALFGLGSDAHLMVLGAITLASLALAPVAAAAALRLHLS